MPYTDTSPRLHLRSFGSESAPPLLLVMGIGLPADSWMTLPERLAARHRVLTFDNRGTGLSDTPVFPYTLGGLADDAARVLDAAQVVQADIFGISMGGMIAQELALRHPQRVRRLILGCTQASALFADRPGPAVLRDLWAAVLKRAPLPVLERLLLGEASRGQPEVREKFARWVGVAKGKPARRPELQALAIALHHTLGRLEQIRAPTLVLAGDEDRVVPIANSAEIARRIPHARFTVLRGAGHVFPVEREEETIAAIEEHLGPLRAAPEPGPGSGADPVATATDRR